MKRYICEFMDYGGKPFLSIYSGYSPGEVASRLLIKGYIVISITASQDFGGGKDNEYQRRIKS